METTVTISSLKESLLDTAIYIRDVDELPVGGEHTCAVEFQRPLPSPLGDDDERNGKMRRMRLEVVSSLRPPTSGFPHDLHRFFAAAGDGGGSSVGSEDEIMAYMECVRREFVDKRDGEARMWLLVEPGAGKMFLEGKE